MSWSQRQKIEARLAKEIALIEPVQGGSIRIALGYPNTYNVGMANLGLQLVYGFLNAIPGVSVERFFLPDRDDLEGARTGHTGLLTYESQARVGDFDLVAFTCSYEFDYVNVLRCLDLAGIPLRSCKRQESDPLVMVGGAITFLNPEPLAPFVDFFCMGEGEGTVQALVTLLEKALDEGHSREELLFAIGQLPSWYVPQFFTPLFEDHVFQGYDVVAGIEPMVAKAYLDNDNFQQQNTGSLIMTPESEFGLSYLVEVSRGCPYVCRFCTVGFSYPKVRWKPVSSLWESIQQVQSYNPKVGLISATVGNYPEIEALCEKLLDEEMSVSFSSLRADKLPDILLETLVRGGSRTMTLAPETGSYELRKSINKRFTDECYLSAVERAFRHGVQNLKMYSMIGLPYETDDDIIALIELVKKTRSIQRTVGEPSAKITLGLGLFVPKPLTPYQWLPQLSMKEAKRRMTMVQKALGGVGGVQVNAESPRVATLEGLLSRADRRMADILEEVYWNPTFGQFRQALKGSDLSFETENYRNWDPNDAVPWGHIRSSWSHDRLLKDGLRAKEQGKALRRI